MRSFPAKPIFPASKAKFVLGLLVIALTAWVVVSLFVVAETSFAIDVNTTRVDFTEKPSDPKSNNAGLFGNSGMLQVSVSNCKGLRPVDRLDRDVPCESNQLELTNVQLSSFQAFQGSGARLAVGTENGRVKITIPAQSVQDTRAVFEASEAGNSAGNGSKANGQPLKEGDWLLQPAAGTMDIWLTEVRPGELRDESNIGLQDGTPLFFEQAGSSSLVGDKNKLVLPRLQKEGEITIGSSGLSVDHLLRANIRKLSIVRNGERIDSFHVLVTGRSREILVGSAYSNEPYNQALTAFESYYHGRNAGRLNAAGIAFAALATIGVAAFSAYISWRQYQLARQRPPAGEPGYD